MNYELIVGIPDAVRENFVEFRTSSESLLIVKRLDSELLNYIQNIENIAEYSYAGAIRSLGESGYSRIDHTPDIGEFSVIGDTVSVWVPGYSSLVRMEYFGDELESIYLVDNTSGRSLTEMNSLWIGNLELIASNSQQQNLQFRGNLATNNLKVLVFSGNADSAEMYQKLQKHLKKSFKLTNYKFDYQTLELYYGRFDILKKSIDKYTNSGFDVYIFTDHPQKIPTELSKFCFERQLQKSQQSEQIPKIVQSRIEQLENQLKLANIQQLDAGIVSNEYKQLIVTDRELFGTIFVTTRSKQRVKSTAAQKLLDQLEGEIEIGEFVVHEDYGVGVYEGYVREEGKDYLKIHYLEDELFVPLDQIEKLTKYLGDNNPEITSLQRNSWARIKKRVEEDVMAKAEEFARHYAQIQTAEAIPLTKKASTSYQQFIDDFQYTETPDQKTAESDIIGDLAKTKPMNRLLIGDVGFGKTEVMMRAAFKVVEAGLQVAILCPTTVLALQHLETFNKRFAKFPVNIAKLSSHNTISKNKQIKEQFSQGKIDILIGTHSLLSKSFEPHNLGLLVIDEEQRFGVKQKEKLRELEYKVHTLAVSATPIPRTLSMALSAIQDISMLMTPPSGRKSVITTVNKLNWSEVTSALGQEFDRGGQAFFIHNEVKTISSVTAKLQQLFPEKNFKFVHGQMPNSRIDKTIYEFYQEGFDCLVATTIIENGVDFPNANTLIVNQSQKLGLAQMYQLRGRVGRSDKQAFAYFFYTGSRLKSTNEITDEQDLTENKPKKLSKYKQRLEAILASQELGSGFKIASRDLEIRGAGNILGASQHGNIAKVGYGLYMQLLAQQIDKIKAEQEH